MASNVVLENPVRELHRGFLGKNACPIAGGNKESDVPGHQARIIPDRAPGLAAARQSARVRLAHKPGEPYPLVEVVGEVRVLLLPLVIESAAVERRQSIRAGPGSDKLVDRTPQSEPSLRLGSQRIVIQGRHTQFFIPSGIEVVPALEDATAEGSRRSPAVLATGSPAEPSSSPS